MTTWMSTLVQIRVRTVKKLQMSHPPRLQRNQREQNQKMILMVPVAEGWTDHLKAQLVRVCLGPLPSQNNLHKPESEDSSTSNSLSSYDESSGEEKVSLKEKMKELPPPLPLKKKHRSQSYQMQREKRLVSGELLTLWPFNQFLDCAYQF